MTDTDLYARLRGVLKRGWIRLPDYPGYGGTGAPGKILEELLGIDGGNSDTPDAGRWEIKFHSSNALLILFHLEGEPKGHMHHMVRAFGWPDNEGRTSFRHTIHQGHSSLGFYVANESGRITVRHPHVSDIVWPYWTHDRLVNAFASKFRRLIVVKGRKRGDKSGTMWRIFIGSRKSPSLWTPYKAGSWLSTSTYGQMTGTVYATTERSSESNMTICATCMEIASGLTDGAI